MKSMKLITGAVLAMAGLIAGSALGQDAKPVQPQKIGAPANPNLGTTDTARPQPAPTTSDGTTIANPVQVKPPAQDLPVATNAEATFDQMNHDYGRLASGKSAVHKFAFKNTGSEVLVIQQVRTSCGCTAAALDKKEYAPGESGTIDVTFNPKGKGVQAKTVTVIHNGKNGPETMLNIKSDVFEVVEITPPSLQLGEMVRGKPRTERVVLLSDDKDLKIKSIDTNGDMVTAVESASPPSDNTDPRPGKIAIDLTFDGSLPVGRFLRIITVKVMASPAPGAPAEEWDLKVNAFANIVGDLKADPPSMRIATTTPNEAFSQEVIVTRRSGQPFNIVSASTINASLPGLEVKYEPHEANGVKGYKVTFSGNTGPSAGIIRGSVLLKTDVPDEPEHRVSFTGMVRDPNAPKPAAVPPGPRPATAPNTSPTATPTATPAPAPAATPAKPH